MNQINYVIGLVAFLVWCGVIQFLFGIVLARIILRFSSEPEVSDRILNSVEFLASVILSFVCALGTSELPVFGEPHRFVNIALPLAIYVSAAILCLRMCRNQRITVPAKR